VSRITRNILNFQTELIDLRDILENAVEASRPLIDEKRLNLSLELTDDVVWLQADPLRLTQVFSNIMNNAAKYTEPGGEIHVRSQVERNIVTVSIKDSGIGIAPDLLPQIFDIFVQGVCVVTSSEGGLGLGLTLAKHLTEIHNGTIEARSEGRGKGSEFTVRLPMASQGGEVRKYYPLTDEARAEYEEWKKNQGR
jgi:signal transduction histidine kinase